MAKKPTIIAYVLLTLFAVGVLIIGMKYTTKDALVFSSRDSATAEAYICRADVVLKREDTTTEYYGGGTVAQTQITFTCTVLFGEKKGETMVAVQQSDNLTGKVDSPVKAGDWLYVYKYYETGECTAGNFFRIKELIILFAVLMVILMFFAKVKGLATVMSLGLTILSVFFVFVPAILSGMNIYVWTMAICVYSIVITPLYIGGFNKKALASIVGCVTGIVVAGIVTVWLSNAMSLTGIADEDDLFVMALLENPIDMKAITFAMILIGALGSTMDVSMSIAASVWEMSESSGKKDFKSLLDSGFNIGRDILGTQISTLVLAYVGASLCTVLLYVAYQPTILELLNVEAVIIQLFDALIGATTIILTIPFTAIVSAIMISRRERNALLKKGNGKKRVDHLN